MSPGNERMLYGLSNTEWKLDKVKERFVQLKLSNTTLNFALNGTEILLLHTSMFSKGVCFEVSCD